MPPEVAEHLGHYVYLYVDPRTEQIFYVGKGQGQRVLSHLSAVGESRKAQILSELRQAHLSPRIDILAHGLPDEATAYRIEAAAIDLLRMDSLSNLVRGWQSVRSGRRSLGELVSYYAAPPAVITDPVMLIRINKLYWHGMPAQELYEATRGIWKVAKWRQQEVKYALAVFEGVVREVYTTESWHPAGQTPYQTRPAEEVSDPQRWEFVGHVAPEEVRRRYLYHSVAAYFSKHSQNPIAYPDSPRVRRGSR
ncbi:hypothetical protein G6R31_06320 [Deinococcus wulumuqiensis R12]|nr:hypothetical protein G6R31_06320 [Deinococcus wulumuqiensis R12]